jgi:hypothetical protein
MELQHFVAKIHVDGALGLDPAKVVDVFHQWVANQTIAGVVLIDVAELLHVPNGPGVVADGIWGVLSRRKNILPGANADRVSESLASAARIGLRLQEAFPTLKLSRSSFELIVNDRAVAPNTAATYAAAVPEIEAALRGLLGHGEFKLTRHDAEPRKRFGVSVTSAKPFDLAALAAR